MFPNVVLLNYVFKISGKKRIMFDEIPADNPSGPLFLHSSDVPDTSLVHVPFSSTGFGGWRRSMIVALSAKNQIAFIDGTCPKPSDNTPGLKQWNRYGAVNRTKVFEIKKELASTCQGSLDIASYFNKLKRLWDELGFTCKNHMNTCTCAAKPGLQQEVEENKLYQFLIGLNETYINVRSNLTMMRPSPSLDNAYNILLQDESPRQVKSFPQFNSDLASFNANMFNKILPPQKPYNQRVNFEQGANGDQVKASLFCKYCKKPGHLIEKCYKLHGYPSNLNFTKGERIAANASVEVDFSELNPSGGAQPTAPNIFGPPSNSEHASMIPGLTKQQYN
ncbi:uncharacterized protein LOC142169848 [Nicotiana tabacum]|uniref:Uncharacterized protein LOC142169848 n=1 Tax=Nicotiana tabacum TaxID=4097 RepID=A0AC58SSC5_TOBAC